MKQNFKKWNKIRLVNKNLREKIQWPKLVLFQTVILRLFGDNDHEKILDITIMWKSCTVNNWKAITGLMVYDHQLSK